MFFKNRYNNRFQLKQLLLSRKTKTGGMEMLSTHFNTQVFINTLKANHNLVIYLSTTFALLLTLLLQGMIKGNLKPEYFVYALGLSMVFCIWAIADQKLRALSSAKK